MFGAGHRGTHRHACAGLVKVYEIIRPKPLRQRELIQQQILRREFAGIFLTYTTKGQQRYSIVWRRWMHHRDLPEGGVIQEERSFWRGSLGYRKTLTSCVAVEMPANAHIAYSGNSWSCDLGYVRKIGSCIARDE